MEHGQRWTDRLRPNDLTGVQDQILEAALELFGGDVAVLYSFNPLTGRFLPPWRSAGELRGTLDALQEPRTKGLTQRVLSGGNLYIDDLAQDERRSSPFTQAEGIRSFAALRLDDPAWDKPLGVLYLDFRDLHSFVDEEQGNLERFAQEAFSQLEIQWRLARYREASRISAEINIDLRTADSLFATLDQHVRGILDTHHFFSLGVFSWRQEEINLHYRSEDGLPQISMHPGRAAFLLLQESLARQSGSGSAFTVPEFSLSVSVPDVGPAPKSYLVAPLLVRRVLLGFICAAHPSPLAFNEEDERLLTLIAQHVSSALNNIRLFQNLRRLAVAGQFLAEPLGEEEALQRVVDEILGATQADIVVLYPYHAESDAFRLPPKFAGNMLNSDFPQPAFCQKGDLIYRFLSEEKSRYFSEANRIYSGTMETLRSTSKFQKRERIVSVAASALRSQGGTAGVLFLNFRRQQPFDAPQRQLIEGLAPFAAAALHNARRFIAAGARRAKEYEIIQEIDRAIDQAVDHRKVLQVILEGANRLLEADAAAILLRGRNGGEGSKSFFVAEAIGLQSENLRGWSTRDEKSGILSAILENRSPVLIDDLPQDPTFRDSAARVRPGTRSELDVPLLVNDEVVGVLNFESVKPSHFSLEDLEFLQLLANQVLIAVGRARDTEFAEQEAGDRKLLMDLTKEIISETNEVKLLPLILEQAALMTGANAGVLLLYDDERGDLEVRFELGTPEDNRGTRFSLNQGIVGYVARTKESLNIDPTEPKWVDIHLSYSPDTRSELAVPLVEGENLRGVLNLESTTPRQFRHRAQRLTEDLARLATIALQNAESLKAAQTELARFNVLAEAGEKLGRMVELGRLSEAYEIVLALAVQQCGGLAVMRGLNSADKRFALVQAVGEPGLEKLFPSIELEAGLNGRAFRSSKQEYEPDLHISKGTPPANPSDPQARSLLVTPVKLGNRYYGNLGASHPLPYHFGQADRRMFEGLAQILAITHNRLEAVHEKQVLEKAKEQNEILGWMGGASFQIAHRLGNRLGAVAARLNQVEDRLTALSIEDSKIIGYLNRIRNQTRLVLELGDRLNKAVAKLKGREPGEFLIGELARELADSYDSLSEGVSARVVLDQDQDLMVHADREHVFHILDNLFQNGLGAIGERSVADPGIIEAAIKREGGMARIDVHDNGCGILAKNLPLIFSFLYSTKGSSGFGLWSALSQARLNGGNLIVSNSQAGQGTTFTLTLPLAPNAFKD